MDYVVQIVGDTDLPEGVHKVVIERPGELPLLLINGEPARCWQFMGGYLGRAGAEHCGAQTALPAERLLYAV